MSKLPIFNLQLLSCDVSALWMGRLLIEILFETCSSRLISCRRNVFLLVFCATVSLLVVFDTRLLRLNKPPDGSSFLSSTTRIANSTCTTLSARHLLLSHYQKHKFFGKSLAFLKNTFENENKIRFKSWLDFLKRF